VAAFRLRGLFFEGDLSTIYEETAAGALVDVRWPFSRFKRVGAQLRVEHSNRLDVVGHVDGDRRRIGWLASNFVNYVHDNTLWLQTGPIDGSRTNVTAGVTNDLTNGRFDAWVTSLDHRRYLRVGQLSAIAVRALGYYAGGTRPRRISIGGPWGLRGYPRIGHVTGTRVFLLNQELRFPLTHHVTLGFPVGELRLPGVQGALFVDAGGAWTATSRDRSVLGSAGLGLRLPIGFPLVLRLDLGYRFAFGETSGYSLPDIAENRRFADFFFGFNY
jgi:hemolysin activation/secretion protein